MTRPEMQRVWLRVNARAAWRPFAASRGFAQMRHAYEDDAKRRSKQPRGEAAS